MSDTKLKLELWPRQFQAFTTQATELLFGGATEGGKSHFLRTALVAWCLAIPGLQCVLIRKKYDDILRNHVEGPTGFRAILAPLLKTKQVTITRQEIRFPNGSIIAFQHCQDERQFDSAQGVEKHVLAIDEATQISERLIRFFRTWVRMTPEMAAKLPPEFQGQFPRIIYTANPIGPSTSFFRRNFVQLCPNEEIKLIHGFKRQYLLSRYTDNLSVNKEQHEGRLQGIGDERLAKALDLGLWDALTGEFFPEWDEERHVVSDFIPPKHWFRYRSFDWGGGQDPAVFYWIAVSDGEAFTDDMGRERWFPRGAKIFFDEWYICDPDNPAKGLGMRNEDMARGAVDRTEYEFKSKMITLTDSFPFADRGGETIAQVFMRNGCPLTLADTSRPQGWSVMRSALIGDVLDNHLLDENGLPKRIPMVYFCARCKYARDYIPALGRHPNEHKREDAQEHGEPTHCNDAVRYGLNTHKVIKDSKIPLQSAIDKVIKNDFATMKKITIDGGAGWFK